VSSLTTSAKAFLLGLALAAAALGASLVSRADVPQGEPLALAILLAALAILLNWRLVYFTTVRGLSLGFAPVFAALLLFDPGVAVAISLIGVLAANLLNRHSFYFAVCDASDTVLATGCAGLILGPGVELFGASTGDPVFLGLALVAAGVMFVINVFDWAAVYVLNGEGTWAAELREIRDGAHVLAFCLEIILGSLVALLAVNAPWALLLLSLPAYAAYVVVERQVRTRRRTQESLVRTEASLAKAQRIAHVGSWEWSVDEDLMMWSDETYRILGLDPQERLATREEYVRNAHPGDRTALREALDRASRTGESFDLEYRVVRPEGNVRYVYLQGEVEQGKKPRLVGTLLDVTSRKELERRLEYQAYHDTLTGLPNRALFTDRLDISLARTLRQGGRVAALLLDLDGFKEVNDTLGHRAGDVLLQQVAERLSACLRPHDTAARLGGDEFVVLLDQSTEDEAAKVAERVISALREPYEVHGRQTRIDTSVGISLSGEDRNPDWLLRAADIAMYEAKRQGRGCYKFYTEPRRPRDFRTLLV
jgi:diguanylate cyclase (GGDEF)-like protein/PAS domain S-box-containing protein